MLPLGGGPLWESVSRRARRSGSDFWIHLAALLLAPLLGLIALVHAILTSVEPSLPLREKAAVWAVTSITLLCALVAGLDIAAGIAM